MVKLTQKKTTDNSYLFLDKKGRLCGSTFRLSKKNKAWLLNPCFPVSKSFHNKKKYICENPKTAKNRLEDELNRWLKTLKKDI